jgi:hypothetical protein
MEKEVVHDFGDGLVLRQAVPDDAEALAEFNGRVHSDRGWELPDVGVAAWVRDLMTKPHPTFAVGDFLVVEDTGSSKIVSSTNLIPQTWSYDGIEFGVGRPELVGTHPDYRRRGLVRAQFEVLHRWSAERGHKLQVVSGIPYYYRQFGYEMGLNLHGGRRGPAAYVPVLGEAKAESYRVRPARVDDLDTLAEWVHEGQKRQPISCTRDAALWRYQLEGQSSESAAAFVMCMVETAASDDDPGGDPVGFLAHAAVRWGRSLAAVSYELKPGISWWAVTPAVLRYLKSQGATLACYYDAPDAPVFDTLFFSFGAEHPSYPVIADWLLKVDAPYAWFVRVADIPDFLRTIAPALEARLAASVMVGHTGELTLSFYRSGVRMVFEQGRLATVESWLPEGDGGSAGCFPDLTFLQLLFGYRSLTELDMAYADCFATLEGRLLLNALFPKKPSEVWCVA